MTPEQAADPDVFFYHDSMDVSDQIVSDLFNGFSQPKRSLFYNRSYGCNVGSTMEGAPNTGVLQVLGAFDVMEFLAIRNGRVSDGRNGAPDRRVAASQNGIYFEQAGEYIDLQIDYIEYKSVTVRRSMAMRLSGG